MPDFSRMPRYDIRNDGTGPYAIFYCDCCSREFRSQADVGTAVAQDLRWGGRWRADYCAKYPCLEMQLPIMWSGRTPATA